tara:strand:- start:1 stop:336 length:336 start_codon:yes stop_codon:yes gene_type:complete
MIINKTNEKVISKQEIICKNIFSQSRGLMFKKKQNLIMEFPFEKKIFLHNFFVFYPIDVILLNKNKEVVEIKRNFQPFTLWNSKNKAKYVIELGRDNSKNVKVKEKIEIKN